MYGHILCSSITISKRNIFALDEKKEPTPQHGTV